MPLSRASTRGRYSRIMGVTHSTGFTTQACSPGIFTETDTEIDAETDVETDTDTDMDMLTKILDHGHGYSDGF